MRIDGAAWLLALLLLVAGPAFAQDGDAPSRSQVTELQVERTSEGVVLFANVRLDLSLAIEDALAKGIPMFFLAEADLVRHRWYWTDKKVVSAQRHMRLAFQPLTQRWRLNVASGPIVGNSLGLALNLHFDSMQEALTTMRRISGWKIAEASALDPDASYKVDFRFSLDVNQLPRPFQIGAFGQTDWSVSASASQQIGPESRK